MPDSSYSDTIAVVLQGLQKKCWRKDKILAQNMGISIPEFNLLTFFGQGSSVMIRELIDFLNLTPGRVTHLVSSLEDRGILRRSLNKNDRRIVIVKLTPKGKTFVDEIQKLLRNYFNQMLSPLKQTEADALLISLERLGEVFDRDLDLNP